jgi:hypothetical protein
MAPLPHPAKERTRWRRRSREKGTEGETTNADGETTNADGETTGTLLPQGQKCLWFRF